MHKLQMENGAEKIPMFPDSSLGKRQVMKLEAFYGIFLEHLGAMTHDHFQVFKEKTDHLF